ncbi:hypothetical protein GCM10027269_18700 [Kribbella endophytica]
MLSPNSQMSKLGNPISAGTGVCGIVTAGAANVVCTSDWSIRTHNVSAACAVGGTLGVSDGVSLGVSVGVVLTETSGGTLGAVSPLPPPQPATARPVKAKTTTGRIRMVTRL